MQGLHKHIKPDTIRLFLAKPNRKIISPLKYASNKKLDLHEESPHELSFSLPYDILDDHAMESYEPTEQLREKFLIKALYKDEEMWFVIRSYNKSSDDADMMDVKCYSYEYTLGQKKLIDFHRESVNLITVAEEVAKRHGWEIGYINPNLNLSWREFDISSTPVLSFFYDDLTETYDAVVVFDTVNKKINFYEQGELSNYKGFTISEGKYLVDIEEEVDSNEVVTRLHITGSDGLGIQRVNPTGQRYIDDFSYYLYPFEMDEDGNVIKSSNFMEDDLAKAIVEYNQYVSSRNDEFYNYYTEKSKTQKEISEEEIKLFDLSVELQTIKDSIAWRKEQGINTSDLVKERNAKNAEVRKQETVIKNLNNKVKDIDKNIEKLREDLKMENHFSPTLLEELEDYIHEDEWTDDKKIDENDLYESGLEKLTEINSPPINISTSLVNFLEDVNAQDDWGRFHLGDIVRIKHDKIRVNAKSRLSTISIDFEAPSIDVEISNTKELNDIANKLKSAFYTIDKVSTDFNKRRIDYDRVTNNFNLRNDRVSEIPATPTVGKDAIQHKENDNASVDITVRWQYPDFNKTKQNEHNIDGFMLYFFSDDTDETYQFTSQMAHEQITSVPYPTRTFVYPALPSNKFYTIGVRAYRRVDADINSDGILMSPIIRFNDGLVAPNESRGVQTFSNAVPTNGDDTITEDLSKPYQPSKDVNFKGKLFGHQLFFGSTPPSSPSVDDMWFDKTNNQWFRWNGEKWVGDLSFKELDDRFNKFTEEMKKFEEDLKKELEENDTIVNEAMDEVKNEMDRIQNEVLPEIEKAVDASNIPRQPNPPTEIPTSGLWWDTSQERLMRWNGEEWVPVALTGDEIQKLMEEMREAATAESRRYTKLDVMRVRKQLTERLESEIGDVLGNIKELEDMAAGLISTVEAIEEYVDNLRQSVEEDRVAVQEGIKRLEDLAEEMKERADSIDELLNEYDGHFTSFRQEINELEGRISTVIESIEEVEGTVSGHSTQLTVLAGELEGKLDSIEYSRDQEGVLQTLTEHSNTIKANSAGLELRVTTEEYEAFSNDISERISVAEYDIGVTSEGLKSKANASEVYTIEQVDEVLGKKLEVQVYTDKMASLDSTIDGLSGSVSNIRSTVDSITGDVTDIKKDITDFNVRAGEIEANLSSVSDGVNGLREDVTAINLRADGIEGRITSVHEDLDGKITTNSNQIDVNAKAIAAKLSSVDYEKDKTDILSSIERNRLDIEATSKGLELRVTKDELQAGLDGIQIGGRNLLRESTSSNLIPTSGGTLTFYSDSWSYWSEVEPERIYTVSRNNLNNNRFRIVYLDEEPKTGLSYLYIDTKDSDMEYTFKVPDNATHVLVYLQYNTPVEGEKPKVKLEKGNKATDWEEAPEDNLERISSLSTSLDIVAGQITAKADKSELLNFVDKSTYNRQVSELTTSIDGITGKVQNIETDLNTATGNITSALSQIGELKVTANGITQSVTELRGDLSSEISSLSGSIETLAGQVNLKASQQSVNSLTGDLTSLKSEVNLIPGKISLAVSDGIEGLEIGGVNLSKDSNNFSRGVLTSYDGSILTVTEGVPVEEWNATDATTIRATAANAEYQLKAYKTLTSITETILGETYSVSLYIKNERDVKAFFRVNGISSSSGSYSEIEIPANYIGRVHVTGERNTNGLQLQFRTERPTQYLEFTVWRAQVEKGNKATDWSLAEEDRVNKTNVLSSINLSTEGVKIQGAKIDIAGLVTILNADGSPGTMISGSKLINQSITTNQLNVNNIFSNSAVIAKIQSDIVRTANLDAGKITTGILNASNVSVINLSANSINSGTLNASQVTVSNINASNITTGTLNASDVKVININASEINSGTLNTGNILIYGGDALNYTLIDGSYLESRGRFRRTWRGTTKTHDIKLRFENGYLRARNDNDDRSLYFTELGISTFADGSGDGTGERSSGTIEFFSRRFNNTYNGLTLYSSAVLGVDADKFKVDSEQDIELESRAALRIRPFTARPGNNTFRFTVSNDSVAANIDGYLLYGSEADPHASGFRFSKRKSDPLIQVVDSDYTTGGDTGIEAGYGRFNTVRRRSGNLYVNLQHDDIMRVGKDGTGRDRVEMGAAYRWTTSASANMHITGEGTITRSTSASKYKLLIENEEEKGFDYNRILDLSVYSWYDKLAIERYSESLSNPSVRVDIPSIKRHFGLIAEDVERVGLSQFVTYDETGKTKEVEGIEYDRLWTLLIPIVKDHRAHLSSHDARYARLENENQTLKNRVKILENKVKILEEKVS